MSRDGDRNEEEPESALLAPGSTSTASRLPVWVLALATTLGMQTVASFLDQSLPIIAPLLLASNGLAPERVGNLSSLNSFGTVLFLLFGGPILARLGPVRMLQAGALLAVAGVIIAFTGWWPILIVAALLMGIGYGPSPPAGSRILARTAPPRHRTLIFSIKQAGAPAGGALAGLVLAPIAFAWGWKSALAVSVFVGLLAAAIIGPVRSRLDSEREPDRPIGLRVLFDPKKVIAPYVMLKASPVLLSVTSLAFSFAVVQGSLFSFTVTYLVISRHLPLNIAGLVYASMQGAGVVARIFLGWLADRTGRPAHNLTAQAFVAAIFVVSLGLLPTTPPIRLAMLLAGGTGFFAASWNGIYLAEVARLSPPGMIGEVTASSAVITFLGYVSGPSIFSLLVSVSGSYRLAFVAVAGQLVILAATQVVVLARS